MLLFVRLAIATVTCTADSLWLRGALLFQDKIDVAENIDLVAPATSKLRQEVNIAEAMRRAEGVRKGAAAAAAAASGAGSASDDSDME